MINTICEAGSFGAGAASRYGSGSNQMTRLLAATAQAPQLWYLMTFWHWNELIFSFRQETAQNFD
jgi:hypothetical protein